MSGLSQEMKRLELSLNQKLIAFTVVVFVVIVTVLMVNDYLTIRRESLKYLKEKSITFSENVKNGIISLMLQGKCERVRNMMRAISRVENVEVLHIFDPESGLVTASLEDRYLGKGLPKKDFGLYLVHKGKGPFFIRDGDEECVVNFLEIENLKACHNCHSPHKVHLGVIEIKLSLKGIFAVIKRNLMQNFLFALCAIILFSLVFSYIIILLVDEPLGRIVAAMEDVEQGNLIKRVPISNNDVIGILAQKFNNMVHHLREAKEELERCHQEQVRRASQMALLGEIASGIAHELKNPLACISSALQVVYNDMGEKEGNKPIVREVINQVRRLDTVVKRILDFAKPVNYQKEVVDIATLIDETLFFVCQFGVQKSIEVNFAHEGSLFIFADAKSLRQVILNICLNAIEAMKEHGKITITARQVPRETISGKHDYVELSIKDTGCGIRDDHLVRIFDPFFTTKEQGTGLGLAISAQIVEEHGGFIEVESEVGKGSLFRVYLPAYEKGGQA